jgi:glycosyltransferase involved in cell wall biosynthesis
MRIITRLNIGGPAYQAIFLSQRLQDAEFQTSLLVGELAAGEGSMEPLARERGVAFRHMPGLGREISPKTDLVTVSRLYREMRRVRPDIVHTHLAKAGFAGRIAAALARIPVVVHTYHGHVFHGYFSKKKTELILRIERALARRTSRIIVLGEAQEKEILGFGVGRPEQMVRIPLGLELEPFLKAEQHRGVIRKELGIGAETQLAGIIARLVPIKAHEQFLEAAKQAAARHPEVQWLIVGDGERRQELEDLARSLGFSIVSHDKGDCHPSGTGPIVRFLGFRSDLAQLYADLDCVVLCSKNEGLPVTIIEALAAARPVVSTEVGSVRDLITPAVSGYLTPAGDASALAESISKLLAQREQAAEMGRRGREHVYPRLSIDRLEGDIRRLYRELSAKK